MLEREKCGGILQPCSRKYSSLQQLSTILAIWILYTYLTYVHAPFPSTSHLPSIEEAEA